MENPWSWHFFACNTNPVIIIMLLMSADYRRIRKGVECAKTAVVKALYKMS